jgi:hypothetical protein
MVKSLTADELYAFICANAEEIDGEIICRASLWAELERLGIPRGPARQQLRVRLVKELEAQGLIRRIHPRSRRLLLINPDRELLHRARKDSRERFQERMGSWSEPGAIKVLEAPKHGCEANLSATNERIATLDDYFRSNVLDGKRFVCASYRECKSSITPGCTFKEGQLSHVGKHYDLSREGRPLRIVVVGQEVAGKGKPRITMAERYAGVHDGSGLARRFDGDQEHLRRNPHMRGTTLALRTIFDIPGTEHATEFLHLGGENAHIFDCFALVNRLLCAAHLEGTSTGKSTKTMLNNCERHFRATIKILEPTIVVTQGIKVWKWSKNVLVPVKQRADNLFECELAGRRVMVAAFTHPSAWGPDRWDSPTSAYFKKVVRPTLHRAASFSP